MELICKYCFKLSIPSGHLLYRGYHYRLTTHFIRLSCEKFNLKFYDCTVSWALQNTPKVTSWRYLITRFYFPAIKSCWNNAFFSKTSSAQTAWNVSEIDNVNGRRLAFMQSNIIMIFSTWWNFVWAINASIISFLLVLKKRFHDDIPSFLRDAKLESVHMFIYIAVKVMCEIDPAIFGICKYVRNYA